MPKPPAAPAILSIQSEVVAGHVGNGAARPALQRLGFEVWALPTIVLSNHPGHGAFRGRASDPALLADLLSGLDEGGWLRHCAGVLTGYMATEGAGAVAADSIARVRAASPRAIVAVDPVMGDFPKGLYVRPELVEVFRDRLVPAADVATPNRFELELLAGREARDLAGAVAAAGAVRAMGPRIVLCTSLERPDRPEGRHETLAVGPDGAWVASVPALAGVPNGAGDLLSALFLAALARGADLPAALGRAVAGTWRVLSESVARGADELALIPALDQLAAEDGAAAEIARVD